MSAAYRDLYEEGKRILEEVPLADAALDARLLLEEVCGTDLQTLLVYPGTQVSDADCARYRSFIERRRLREPAAMILGTWDFMGLTFRVTKDTLIPEQDTEVLVETALSCCQNFPGRGKESSSGKAPLRILDLCTGTGCILLSLLHFLPEAEGIGTDLSGEALLIASENAGRLGLEDRSRFFQGDLWEALPDPGERFDLIVSNPPYVPTDVIPTLAPEVRCGEPLIALDGGADGLAFYRRIFKRAPEHLSGEGLILVEAGFEEAAAIRALMEESGLCVLRTVKDYGGLERVVAGRRRPAAECPDL